MNQKFCGAFLKATARARRRFGISFAELFFVPFVSKKSGLTAKVSKPL